MNILSFSVDHNINIDYKMFAKVFKNNEMTGSAEFILPIYNFSKKDKNFKKWIPVINDKKAKKFTSTLDQLKLLIVVDIQYDGKANDILPQTEPNFKKKSVNTSKHIDIKEEKLNNLRLFSTRTKPKFEKLVKKISLNKSLNDSILSSFKDNKEEAIISKPKIEKKISSPKIIKKNNQVTFDTNIVLMEFNLDESIIDPILNETDDQVLTFETAIKQYKAYYNQDYINL